MNHNASLPDVGQGEQRTPKRSFRACRWCRKQKMRCDAEYPKPCSRCQNAGRECIIDQISSEKRHNGEEDHINSKRQKQLEDEVRRLRSELEEFRNRNENGYDSRHSRARSFSNSPPPESLKDRPHSGELEQLNGEVMSAPQSAIHSLSINMGMHFPTPIEQSFSSDGKADIVTRGILSEEKARTLFDTFMSGVRSYFPLFSAVRDTFESLRERSPFCFTVIISLASRALEHRHRDSNLYRFLQDEAQRLAEDSLFERPTKLETVQGLLVLAAYSEKTWFATALTLRTAIDLDLEKSLSELNARCDMSKDRRVISIEDHHLLWRTRTWLMGFSLEMDVASGIGRQSRINDMDVAQLRAFLDHPLSSPSDMRIVSIIELHQLRAFYRRVAEKSSNIERLLSIELPESLNKFQQWFVTWDEAHQNHGFHVHSFQRCSLRLQINYAKIYAYCTTLAQLPRLKSGSVKSALLPEDPNILRLSQSLLSVILEQFDFLQTESAYHSQFMWAPSYAALTMAFIATFALRIARWHPILVDRTLLLRKVRQVSDLLKRAPYPDIHRTVCLVITYEADYLVRNDPNRSAGKLADPLAQTQSNIGSNVPQTTTAPLFGSGANENDVGVSNINNDRILRPLDIINVDSGDQTGRPVRPPETTEAPTYTFSSSLADSFGFFDGEQPDFLDFMSNLPPLP